MASFDASTKTRDQLSFRNCIILEPLDDINDATQIIEIKKSNELEEFNAFLLQEGLNKYFQDYPDQDLRRKLVEDLNNKAIVVVFSEFRLPKVLQHKEDSEWGESRMTSPVVCAEHVEIAKEYTPLVISLTSVPHTITSNDMISAILTDRFLSIYQRLGPLPPYGQKIIPPGSVLAYA